MKNLIINIVIICFTTIQAHAITYTFLGTYSADWNNDGNWKSPAGKPPSSILTCNKVIIEKKCSVPSGITITNYGEIVIKNSCFNFDFQSINNFGLVAFENNNFQQALGSTFKNYTCGVIIMPTISISKFNRFINHGNLFDTNTYASLSMQDKICKQ